MRRGAHSIGRAHVGGLRRARMPGGLGARPLAPFPKLVSAVFADHRIFVAVGLVLTYIWRFHSLTPALGRLRAAALFSVASWLLLVLAPDRTTISRALKRPYVLAFIAWWLWIGLSTPFSLVPSQTWGFFSDTQFKNVLFVLFLASAVADAAKLKLVVIANVFGASVVAAFYVKAGTPGWGTPIPMYDINDFALILNMTIPLAVWGVLNANRRWEKGVFGTAALLMVASVIGTGSRGGFLALATVGVYYLVRSKGLTWKRKTLVLGALVASLGLAPDAYWDRMATIIDPSEDYNVTSDAGRIEVWKRGIGYWKDFPLFGVGAEGFADAERQFNGRPLVTHNSYIQTLAETGTVGFLFWGSMLLGTLLSLRRLGRTLKRSPRPDPSLVQLGEALAVAMLAFGVGSFFLSQAFNAYVLTVIAMTAGLAHAVERERLRPQAPLRSPHPMARRPAPRPALHRGPMG